LALALTSASISLSYSVSELPELLEEEEEDSDEEYHCEDDNGSESSEESENVAEFDEYGVDYGRVKNKDIPQAFSCYTYTKSRRKILVCDLQGVFNTDRCPPVFECTDPAIHHFESFGKRRHYGASDKGQEGMDNFFKTHVCSNLCHILQKRHPRLTPRNVVFRS